MSKIPVTEARDNICASTGISLILKSVIIIFPLDEVALKSSDVNSNFPFSNPFIKLKPAINGLALSESIYVAILPFLFLLILMVIFSLLEKIPFASSFANFPFKIVPVKLKSLISSFVPVSTVSKLALIVPLNFFETNVDGLELVRLSIIYFASNLFPVISM